MTDHWPLLHLQPEDAGTIQAAAVQFARSLAGAPSRWFRLAVAEQRQIVRDTIERAGYEKRQARIAASTFQFAARAEWQRIASTAQPAAWGRA
jgi:hypothetical protein